MAKNLRDKGYSSSMDGYKQDQKKKQKETNEALKLSLPAYMSKPTQNGKLVLSPVASKKEEQPPQKQRPVVNLRDKGFSSSMDGYNTGTATGRASSSMAPISTQRMSPARSTATTPISEAEFNRSSAMQRNYGTYQNYLNGKMVTGGGYYHTDAPDFNALQTAQNNFNQARMTVMGKLADAERKLQIAGEMKGPLRPDQEVARVNAVRDYQNVYSAAEKITNDYFKVAGDNDRIISQYMADIDDARSKVRNGNAIQAEYDDIERQISALNRERSGLQVSYQGGKLMEDVLAPFSPAASADALSSAMNASERVKTIDKLIEELRAKQALLQEEMQISRDNYWSAMASSLPDSVKRAADKSGAVYQHGINIGDIITDKARYLTDEEKDTLERIVENYGTKKGKEYYDYLSGEYLNTRRRRAEEDAMRKFVGSSDGVGEAAWWLDSVLLKPLSVLTYAGQMLDYLGDGRLQKDAGYNRFSYLNTAIRSQVESDFNGAMDKIGPGWKKYGDFGYQVATSTLDFLYNWFLSAGIGTGAEAGLGAAGTSETLQSLKEAENLSLMLMGTEVAADTIIQAKDRGLSDGQAIVLGNAAGVIEIFSEKVSVEALLDGLGDRNAFAYLLKNFVSEGSEEGVSALMNKAVDVWVSKDQSEWRQAIRDYKNSNPGASDEEALKAVWGDAIKEIGAEMLAGGMSGLGMGFGFLAGNNYMQNRAAITNRENVSSVIRQADGLGKNSAGYKAAQSLQAKLDTGENISVRDVQNAMREIDTDRRTSTDYVQARVADAEKYIGTEAATKAALMQEKIDRGESVSYRDVVALETATDKARATSSEYLSPLVEIGKADAENSPAYKAAVKVEQKLQSGQDVTVREAAQLEKATNESLKEAFDSGNADVIGSYMISENGRKALTDAATILKNSTAQSDIRRGNEMLQAIKDGNLDAKTAGEVFLRSQKILENTRKQRQNIRVLKPREVTADMDAYDRSAAELGISEEEASHNKAILQAFGVEGEYKSFENNNLSAYYNRSTGKVYINANAQNPGLALIAHEVTHSFENTAAYRKLADLVFGQSDDLNADLQRITQEYKDAGINLDDAGARSELVTEFVEQHMFNDEKFINDVVSTDRTLAQKFLAAIDNLLAKLGNKNAQQRQLLRHARDLWAEALQQRKTSDKAKAKIAEKRSEAKKGLTLPTVEAKAAAVRKTEVPKNLSLSRANDGIQAGIRQAVLTAGIDISRDSSGKLVFKIGGESVDHVTADHIRDSSAFGAMISLARDGAVDNEGNTILKGHITEDEANEQYQAVADLMNTVMTTQNPEMVWELAGSQMFAAVKSNSDGQYGTTVDFTTVCRKTQEMITAMSERMMAKKGGLTKAEVIELQADLIEANLNVPCPVCYVFSRWAGVGTLLDNMYKFQQKYANMTDAEIADAIDRLRARDKKADRARLRSDLRNPESAEFDEAYYDLVSTRERLRADNKALRKQLKTAEKNGIQADIDSLSKSIAFNNDSIKNLDKQIKDIENAADTAGKELVWLEKVRTKATYKAVPAEILFNMADGEAIESFMRDYPDSWSYRTTRGPAMGKAITPYSDMRLGDLFMSLKSNSAAAFAKGRGNVFSNPLGVKGKFNKKQMNEIIKAIARTRAQNLIGGQRFQSTSDFRYDYALDYIQTFFEAQALGSNMQTYTKIIEFGEMVAKIGGDVNLSVMPRNKGYEGEKLTYADGNYSGGTLIYSNVTGINFGAAKLLSEKYDSAQLILVGINDDHIRLALNDTTDTGGAHVGFVIPYHASGASIDTFIRELVKNLNEEFKRENYTDYSTVQTDTEKAGATALQRRLRDLRKAILTGNRTILQKVMDENGRQAVDSNGDPKFTKKTIPWIPKRSEIDFMRNLAKNKTDITGRSFEDLLDVERRALQGDPEAIRDYESWSADLLLNLYKKMWTRNGAENGVRLNSSQAAAIMPHEYWDTNSTRDTAYLNNFIFRSYCYNLGLNPRFTGIDSKGNVVDFGDFSDCRGYWKTLIDRAMYDNNGNYRAQQPINMSKLEVGMIQEEEGRKAWGDAVVKKPDVAKAKEIGKQYAISKSDTAYLKAVESGDMEMAQRMVDEAAKKAGYEYKGYHHTENSFTVFDRNRARRSMDIQGFFFSADPDAESEYGSIRYDTYLKMENPYIVDSSEKMNAPPVKFGTEDYGVKVREWLQKNGYDSVIRKADFFGSAADEYIVFDPEQIKSADPVTYDDSGKPIPLSERFNPENKDIRYAISKDATLNENLGYHAGDLGKAEYLKNQGRSRGTGHFGTGTYFVGTKEKVTEDSHYGKRPQHAVDFSDYNLYKVRNDRDGYRLHDALQVIDGGLDEDFVKKAEAGDIFALRFTDAYDIAREKFGEDAFTEKNLISAFTDYADQNGIEIQSREEFLKDNSGIDEDEDYYYLEYLEETIKKAVDEVNEEYSRVRDAIFHLGFSFHFDDAKINRALNKVLEYQKATPRFSKSDSYATVFMKAMGYDGVDVRGTGLDNTGYGSVIYDVKKDTIRYAINKDATIRTESELIDSVIDPKEMAKAGVQDAVDAFNDSVDMTKDIPGRTAIRTSSKSRGKPSDNGRFLYRKMVDSGEAVSRLGRYANDVYLYPYYNMARASSNAAISMIQNAQTDVMGRRVGDSLNDIFSAIRAKGDEYYSDLQLYLYHLHNIARMSRANPGAVATAQDEYEAWRKENPEFAHMLDSDIKKIAYDPTSYYHDQARQGADIIHRLEVAQAIQNKPIFGHEVSAEVSRESAARLREKLEQTEGFEEDVEKIRKYIDNLMQYRIDSGLFTEENYEKLKKIYPDYVPVFYEYESESKKGRKEKRTEVGSTVGRAQGVAQETPIMPLHKALAQQTMSAVREGSKNRFGQRLLEKQNLSRNMIKGIDTLLADFNEETFDQPDAKRQNAFVVRQNGKRYEMTLGKDLYEAIDVLSPSPQDTHKLLDIYHKAFDLFKAGVTGYNPVFAVKNPIRDLQDAGLYSKDLSEFVKQYPKTAKEIRKNGKYWQLYQAMGGLYSSVFDYEKGELEEHGWLRRNSLDRMEALNMAIEQAPRLAEFMATIKKAEARGEVTMDDLMEAVHNAADVTVNFGRSGKWGKWLNRNALPFFNPGIQGADKFVRRFTETEGAKDWLRLTGKAALFGILPAILNKLLWGKRKDWDELKQSDRDNYYLFPIPWKEGVWLRLPKGRALALFGMATDRIIQGKDADWASFITTGYSNLGPSNPLKTNFLTPLLEADLFDPDSPGTTWYGGDIESQRLQNLAPGERYDASTDALSKWLGKTFNLSPKKINYILDQYSGVVGDILIPLTSDRAEKDLFSAAFTIDAVASNRLSDDFYKLNDELTWAKNDPESGPEDSIVSKYWAKQTSAVSDINKAIRAIEEDKTLTDKEKREMIRAQYAMRNGIMRNALDTLDDYRKAVEEAYANSTKTDPDDRLDEAYREANKNMFGAEYALQTYNKKVYEAATQLREDNGISYDGFYKFYFARQEVQDQPGTSAECELIMKQDMNDSQKQALYEKYISHKPITLDEGMTMDDFLQAKIDKAEAASEPKISDVMETQAKQNNPNWDSMDSKQQKYATWDEAAKSGNDDALTSSMSDSEARKYQTATDHGIDTDVFVSAFKAVDQADLDNDANRSYKQEEVKTALDSMDLTNEQRAVLWQVISSAKSGKNNPYDPDLGQQIYDEMQASKSASAGPQTKPAPIRPMGLRLPKIG